MNQTQAYTEIHSHGSVLVNKEVNILKIFLRKPWLSKELLCRPEIIINNSKISIIVLIQKRREK